MVSAALHTTLGTALGWVADDATPSPAPAVNPDLVTPGTIGFIVTFAVMILAVLLIIDMTRRIRRVNMRQQVAEKLDAEEAARAAADRGPGAKK
ncbi:hypothetical protein [Subtercola boreus]|uniref:Uncharacterized protein n=1 Tax=Subtercola boreus TaxID=120213 RepID=A0A3E0W9P7_9MICO|nr:hypothetical protein [Subtercola boreus]RFA20033.1 hypothetical protein B7R24_10670 [Subtercola boreus]RFA20162.1 hypothetical protein B7R23_10610 [Subtercola boreus]RFA26489.1 hypothetical protein B7R25_10735 [Subtercola boreus]